MDKNTRQLQKDQTRSRLFAAAAELFAKRGYHRTTVDQIARRAKVAKATFFFHFASKEAVVVELVRKQLDAARLARAQVLERGGSAVDALRATVLTLGTQAGQSRELSRAVLAATLESPVAGGDADALFGELHAEMIADARAAQRAGLLESRPDAETIASALMASYLGAALHFTSSPRARPLAEILRPLVEANLTGFYKSSKETSHAPHASRPIRRRPHAAGRVAPR